MIFNSIIPITYPKITQIGSEEGIVLHKKYANRCRILIILPEMFILALNRNQKSNPDICFDP